MSPLPSPLSPLPMNSFGSPCFCAVAPLIALSRHGLEWFLTTAPMPASQPASYPYLSLSLSPLPPSFPPLVSFYFLCYSSPVFLTALTWHTIMLMTLLFMSPVSLPQPPLLLPFPTAAAAATKGEEEEEKRKTMPTSFMCILGSLPLPPLLLMQCTMPIFGPPLILTHYSLSYLQSHSL